MATNKNKHLTQDDRNVIAIGIVNGSSKKAIADNRVFDSLYIANIF